MATEVYIDFSHLIGKTKAIALMASNIGMEKIGQRVKQLNLEQIKNYKEADGTSVKEYNYKYAARKGVSKANVDYTGLKRIQSKTQKSTGHMMKAFTVIAKVKSAFIGFEGETAQEKAMWNTEHRKFIGLTKRNADSLLKWIKVKFNI